MNSRRASGSESSRVKVVARNRRAHHDYHILETFDAGIVLTGSEVKSLRAGHASLGQAYAAVRDGEVWVEGVTIAPYDHGGYANHPSVRPRKLLLHRREINRLIGSVERKGLALIPLELYFKDGWAKVKIALARGKKTHDRREDIRRRDAEREIGRHLKRRV